MTNEAAGYRHGDLVTVAGDQLVVFHHEDQWVEATPPGSAIHVTVHQNQVDAPLKVGSLFTGYGGLDQAARAVFGGELAWVCDNHPSAVTLLQHRHPVVPNLGDITAIDWEQVEPVDVLGAGFPCTDISNAGQQAGIEGAQSGLWSHVVHAVRVLRPRHVVLENVSALLVRGLDRVAADLAALGYDLRWVCLRASDIGAPHRRDRWFGYATPADTDDLGRERHWGSRDGSTGPADHRAPAADAGCDPRQEDHTHGAALGWRCGTPADADRAREQQRGRDVADIAGRPHDRVAEVKWGQFEPAIRRWEAILGRSAPEPTEPGRNGKPVLSPRFVEHLMGLPAGWVTGVPDLPRTQQLRLLGNGVVPQQGEAAIRHLLHLDAFARAA